MNWLLIDDDRTFLERLGAALRKRGERVRLAATAEEALREVLHEAPDRVVLDLRLGDRSGLEVLARLQELSPQSRVVILTGYGSIATTVDAMRLGAVNYLAKPVDADQVLAAFARSEAPPLAPEEADYEAPSLARLEWDHIQRVLSDCGGNISKAARLLGLHRRTLQRKLQTTPPRR